jgi:hypothetical protein
VPHCGLSVKKKRQLFEISGQSYVVVGLLFWAQDGIKCSHHVQGRETSLTENTVIYENDICYFHMGSIE